MQNNLGSDPIRPLVWRIAFPSMLAQFVSVLYSIVDRIYISNIPVTGETALAGVGVCGPVVTMLGAFAFLVGVGGAPLMSINMGAGRPEEARRILANSFLVLCVCALVLTAAVYPLRRPMLMFFGASDVTYPYAEEYFSIYLAGTAFNLLSLGMNQFIISQGFAKKGMFSVVLGAALNIVLDPLFIFVFHMGVRGAAIATVIGQAASCFVTILYFRKPKSFRFSKTSFLPDWRLLGQIGQLGISSFITQIAIVIVMSVSNNMIGLAGPKSIYGADIPLSVVGIVMKVFGIVIAFSVGIAVGGQPVAGYNYGAGNFKRVFDTYRHIIAANAVVGIIATLLFEFCPQAIVSLFGSESSLYNEYADMCFRIFLGGILLCCVQKASSIFLQSIGKPVKATVLSLSRDVIFLVPGVILLSMAFGVTGMLWAAPIADVLSLILTIILVSHEYKCLKRMEVKTHG